MILFVVKHYQVLFIDLDNTLYDFTGNSREAYRAVYSLLDYDRWFDSFEHYYSIYEEYNLQLWALYAEGKGWFPDDDGLVGMQRINSLNQYISPGLGAPAAQPLPGRFFNQPAVTLLKFTARLE